MSSRKKKRAKDGGVDDMRTLLERMPWRGKFTTEEVALFEARRMRLVDAMTDAVGLFGQVMYTDFAYIALLAAHVALAGDFFDDGRGKFIDYRIRDAETVGGMVVFEGVREWRKCGEFDESDPPPPPPIEREALARAAANKIREQLDDDVIALVAEDLATELAKHEKQSEPTKRQRAEGKRRESELRDQIREDDTR